MPSSIILEHFRFRKDAEFLLNNIRNRYMYMSTHIYVHIQERRKLLFSLIAQRRNLYIEEAIIYKIAVHNYRRPCSPAAV